MTILAKQDELNYITPRIITLIFNCGKLFGCDRLQCKQISESVLSITLGQLLNKG